MKVGGKILFLEEVNFALLKHPGGNCTTQRHVSKMLGGFVARAGFGHETYLNKEHN